MSKYEYKLSGDDRVNGSVISTVNPVVAGDLLHLKNSQYYRVEYVEHSIESNNSVLVVVKDDKRSIIIIGE